MASSMRRKALHFRPILKLGPAVWWNHGLVFILASLKKGYGFDWSQQAYNEKSASDQNLRCREPFLCTDANRLYAVTNHKRENKNRGLSKDTHKGLDPWERPGPCFKIYIDRRTPLRLKQQQSLNLGQPSVWRRFPCLMTLGHSCTIGDMQDTVLYWLAKIHGSMERGRRKVSVVL